MEICLIKLGALGDAIRTIPIARAIKSKHPSSKLTWVTKQEASDLLIGEETIDSIKSLPYTGKESFDVLYNLDIDDEATELASKIKAKEKFGFYSESGHVSAFNLGAEYYLNTLFDDEIKKSNKKTYQEMMFEVAELDDKKEPYSIVLNSNEQAYGENFLRQNNLSGREVIGVHMGTSSRWPSKVWSEERVREFVIKVKKLGKEIILFGGPNEIEKHEKLFQQLDSEGIHIFKNNPRNTLREFAALLNICTSVVCSDSLALHVAIGLGKPTVGLFFCTSPHEVEPYSFLKKIESPMLRDFFPEKMDKYSEELTNSISSDEVIKVLTAKWTN